MALNHATCASQINSAYVNTISFPRSGDYPAIFADIYNGYAVTGAVIGAINTGGQKSIIESALRAAPTTPELLGLAFAQFWATVAIVPQSPNILSVNDALSPAKILNFISAVDSSLTTAKIDPPFDGFISKLEIAARSLLWTITPPSGPPILSGVV